MYPSSAFYTLQHPNRLLPVPSLSTLPLPSPATSPTQPTSHTVPLTPATHTYTIPYQSPLCSPYLSPLQHTLTHSPIKFHPAVTISHLCFVHSCNTHLFPCHYSIPCNPCYALPLQPSLSPLSIMYPAKPVSPVMFFPCSSHSTLVSLIPATLSHSLVYMYPANLHLCYIFPWQPSPSPLSI